MTQPAEWVPDTRPCPLCSAVVPGAVTKDGKFLPRRCRQHAQQCPNFSAPPGKPTSAPLDFFKSVTWLANIGHFLAGYAVVVTAACWTNRFSSVLWTTLALIAYGIVKETSDLFFESGETVRSSTIDFLGYMAGALVAWIEVLFRSGVL